MRQISPLKVFSYVLELQRLKDVLAQDINLFGTYGLARRYEGKTNAAIDQSSAVLSVVSPSRRRGAIEILPSAPAQVILRLGSNANHCS